MVLRTTMRASRPVASITSRQFNHDVGAAKRAAQTEPVVITDRGVPAYVLMTYEQYRRTAPAKRTLIDIFRMDDDIEIEFEPARMDFEAHIPDFED